MSNILGKILSIKNEADTSTTHKVITLLGIKIKLKMQNHQIKPTIPYMETHLCDHCNLNCKGCGHHCPDVNGEVFTDLEQFKKDISELAKKINIKKIRLMGGEPLLHKQVNEFIIETRKAFPKTDLRLVTNGILLPTMKEDFWRTCRENNVTIDMSKYPIVGNKFAEYLDLLDDNNVKLGSIHLSKKFFTLDNPKCDSNMVESWKACLSKNCVTLWQSKLYPCGACFRQYHNLINEEKLAVAEGYDIYTLDGEKLIQNLNKPHSACKGCFSEPIWFPWEREEKAGNANV